MMNERDQARQNWLTSNLPAYKSLQPLAGDASFRQYFRLHSDGVSYVLMDAPPKKESCRAFIAIAHTFQQLGLAVPEIYHADPEQGFLLLSDFGDCQLLDNLSEQTADTHYHRAFDNLLTLQKCQHITNYTLPSFDETLYQAELDLFRDWYLDRHLGLSLSAAHRNVLDQTNRLLIEAALAQPQVCVHRDYHSRNLMVLPDGHLGILDFQDAVWGPITYDVISLLRDCYIAWPFERVRAWTLAFQQRLLEENLLGEEDPDLFLRWCDWMALQRHLKCLGIFSRLYYRDNKKAYMKDIPRVLAYAQSICQRHPEFTALGKLL